MRSIISLLSLQVGSEILIAFGSQVLLSWALDLSLWGYVLGLYAFALHWSVLQYADYTWSSRDIENGAWNLQVLPRENFKGSRGC